MRLSAEHQDVLIAMQQGDRLKVHRTVDGVKQYLLHRLNEAVAVEIKADVVDALVRAGLIESNMKFPAATFLLTDKGAGLVARLTGDKRMPVGPRNFG
ncbi:MAG: hypothetical protein NZ553_18255 [Caldilinea sp.]|nr:hypothetical protein [Caldilinea sp.]MDW8442425.1 hypothetical protein [Caldilineaceae bacterium]